VHLAADFPDALYEGSLGRHVADEAWVPLGVLGDGFHAVEDDLRLLLGDDSLLGEHHGVGPVDECLPVVAGDLEAPRAPPPHVQLGDLGRLRLPRPSESFPVWLAHGISGSIGVDSFYMVGGMGPMVSML